MNVLVVTNMYPQPEQPSYGTFVKDQVEALRRMGVEVDVLLVDGPKSTWNYLWGPFQLWTRLFTRRYDVIHAHYVFSGIIARLQPSIPVVVTYHGSELGNGPDYWLTKLSRAVYPLFQRVIVVSPQMKQMLDGTKVRVIPCGVDLDAVKPIPVVEARRSIGLPVDKPLVLWVSDPQRSEKRYDLLEGAMGRIKQDLPDAEAVVITGQPYQVIPIYMSACDVLALTSDYEGSPMVIKEAMACNLPIVSTDVGDVADVIGDTEHCHLVEPTPESVAEKLFAVLSARPRTDGRDKIGHLTVAAIAERIIKVYRELC